MKNLQVWAVFAVTALAWLAIFLILPPNMSGTDVFIFRDAGWNLAATGHFEAAGLMYMPDLQPRLYAHYTPILPLLFAGYASIFPRNAYAGTVFNLLLGLAAAAVALAAVLRHPPCRLRTIAAFVIAVLPIVFITSDRPESLALLFFAATVALASRGAHPFLVGLAIAIAFLEHPFIAIAAAMWISAIALARNWDSPSRWMKTLSQVAATGVSAILLIAAVGLLFHFLDSTSLMRFATHALGAHSGVSQAKSGGWTHALHFAAFGVSPLASFTYLASLAAVLLLAIWAVRRKTDLSLLDGLLIATGVCCTLVSIALFSFQYNYVVALGFFIPVGLLIAGSRAGSGAGSRDGRLAAVATGLLIFALLIKLPVTGLGLLERAEQRATYRVALAQPGFLRAALPSPDAVIALEGDSYDLFKPEFRHMITLRDAEDQGHFAGLAAVANCYDGYHGSGNAPRPLSPKLNPADFHMIQPDPQHMWITLFGHRMMHAQWGYGCDLYVRNSAPQQPGQPQGIRITQ